MNITLKVGALSTSSFDAENLELAFEGVQAEESLDILALLVNSGVIPTTEDFDIEIENEYDDCEDCCQLGEETPEGQEPTEAEFVYGLLQAVQAAMEAAGLDEEDEEDEEEEEPQFLVPEEFVKHIFSQILTQQNK